MKKIKKSNDRIYYEDDNNLWMYRAIEEKNYKTLKILKDDHRSYVSYIELYRDGKPAERVVLKIPREKNHRVKERIFSILKGGESKREFKNNKKVLDKGFLGPCPLIAVEKKYGIIVIDSYLLLTYIDGEEKNYNNIPIVLPILYKVHEEGYLHGDAQLSNFIVKGTEVYLIDAKMSKNNLGIFFKIKEFIYFEKSCYREIETHYKKNNIYTLIKKYDKLKDRFNYFSKKIRGK